MKCPLVGSRRTGSFLPSWVAVVFVPRYERTYLVEYLVFLNVRLSSWNGNCRDEVCGMCGPPSDEWRSNETRNEPKPKKKNETKQKKKKKTRRRRRTRRRLMNARREGEGHRSGGGGGGRGAEPASAGTSAKAGRKRRWMNAGHSGRRKKARRGVEKAPRGRGWRGGGAGPRGRRRISMMMMMLLMTTTTTTTTEGKKTWRNAGRGQCRTDRLVESSGALSRVRAPVRCCVVHLFARVRPRSSLCLLVCPLRDCVSVSACACLRHGPVGVRRGRSRRRLPIQTLPADQEG